MSDEMIPDPVPQEEGSREAPEREGADLMELMVLDQAYHDPKVLERLIALGWEVSVSKDAEGRVAKVEIRNDKGELEFYENAQALSVLAANEAELLKGAEN